MDKPRENNNTPTNNGLANKDKITIDQKEFSKKTSVRVKVLKLSIVEINVINY